MNYKAYFIGGSQDLTKRIIAEADMRPQIHFPVITKRFTPWEPIENEQLVEAVHETYRLVGRAGRNHEILVYWHDADY